MWTIETSSFVQGHCLRLYVSKNTTHNGLLDSSTHIHLSSSASYPIFAISNHYLFSAVRVVCTLSLIIGRSALPRCQWHTYGQGALLVFSRIGKLKDNKMDTNLKETFKLAQSRHHPPHSWPWLVMVASLFDLITHYLRHNDMILIWRTKTKSTVRLTVPLLYN